MGEEDKIYTEIVEQTPDEEDENIQAPRKTRRGKIDGRTKASGKPRTEGQIRAANAMIAKRRELLAQKKIDDTRIKEIVEEEKVSKVKPKAKKKEKRVVYEIEESEEEPEPAVEVVYVKKPRKPKPKPKRKKKVVIEESESSSSSEEEQVVQKTRRKSKPMAPIVPPPQTPKPLPQRKANMSRYEYMKLLGF